MSRCRSRARATVAVSDTDLSFTNLTVTAGKTSVRGRFGLKLSSPIEIDGDIAADDVDAAALSAMLLGLPVAAAAGGNSWSSELIGAGAFSTATDPSRSSSITRLLRRPWPPATSRASCGCSRARDRRERYRRQHRRRSARRRVDVPPQCGRLCRPADTSTLPAPMPPSSADRARKTIDGRLTMKIEADGIGLSPEALIGSMHGGGYDHADGRALRRDRRGRIRCRHSRRPTRAARSTRRRFAPRSVRSWTTAVSPFSRGRCGLTITAGQPRLQRDAQSQTAPS